MSHPYHATPAEEARCTKCAAEHAQDAFHDEMAELRLALAASQARERELRTVLAAILIECRVYGGTPEFDAVAGMVQNSMLRILAPHDALREFAELALAASQAEVRELREALEGTK